MLYKAFISYSHAADGKLAPAIQSALHSFAKPWYRLRAMRVFRDKTSLSANPGLWSSIEKALVESEYFLFMASPDAVRSPWVGRELAWWLENRSFDRIILLVTDGQIIWDKSACDFDWSRTTAVPATVRGRCNEEPLYVDLRWARTEENLSLRHSQFRNAVLDIATPLHGRPKDELDGEDVRQHRRLKTAAGVGVLAVFLFALIAAWQAKVAKTETRVAEANAKEASRQKNLADEGRKEAEANAREADTQRENADERRQEAERQSRIATSRELAAAAINNLNLDPERSILLTLQAISVTRSRGEPVTPEAVDALHQAVQASRAQRTLAHGAPVTGVAYNKDGTRLATASGAGKVTVWDTRNGSRVALLTLSGSGTVNGLAFNPDGNRLAAASSDGNVRIWGTQLNSSEPLVLGAETSELSGLDFSPDGKRLAAGGKDGKVRIWDGASGDSPALLLTLTGHTDTITGVAFSPDGEQLATGSLDRTARVWDISPGTVRAVQARVPLILTYSGMDWVFGLVFTRDGKQLVTSNADKTATVWDLSPGISERRIKTLVGHTDLIWAVAISPDGRYLSTGSRDRTARVWDLLSGRVEFVLAAHTDEVVGVTFAPDGKTLASASRDGSARIWNVSSTQELLTLLTCEHCPVEAVTFNRTGTRLAAGTGGTDRVWLWTVASGELVAPPLAGHTNWITGLAFDQDGTHIATASWDGTARVWNLSSKTPEDREPLVLGTQNGAKLHDITFTLDGTQLITSSWDGQVKVWHVSPDATTNQPKWTLRGHRAQIHGLALSPDGTRLATASADSTAKVWDITPGDDIERRVPLTFSASRDWLWAVAFSPGGNCLAAASRDGKTYIWRLFPGAPCKRPLSILAGHTQEVRAVAFSPDGKMLATASSDRTAKLWDVTSGAELLTLTGHSAGLRAVAFSPDGSKLATGAEDGTVRLYLLHDADLVDLAQQRVTRRFRREECQQYLHQQECPPYP